MFMEGQLISGEFDETMNEFTLQQVKHFTTETTINENQLKHLSAYLQNNHDPDGQIITLYDQMPLRLSEEEVEMLVEHLEKIQTKWFS